MRVSVLMTLGAVVLMVALLAPQCHAQGWEAAAAAVASKIVGLWRNNEVDLLGHRCHYTVRPKIKKWQLYYRGRMWCPGWTNIRGEVETRSQSGVVGRTTTDFVRKAFDRGLITQADANAWLNS